MYTTSALFAALLAAQQVAATTNWNTPGFTTPQNCPTTCNSEQSGGFDWSSVSVGATVSIYGGYKISGATCQSQGPGGPLNKRSLMGRTTQDKCITGKVSGSADECPKMSCGSGSDKQPNFSSTTYQVSCTYDTTLDFTYTMADGSKCMHTSACNKAGNTVVNDQCGGAVDVTCSQSSDEKAKNKGDCSVGIHSIGFHCGGQTSISTPPAAPKTSTTPVYNKPSTYSVPVISSPKPSPSESSSTPANKPSTYSVPVISSPSSTAVATTSTPANKPSTYSVPVISSPSSTPVATSSTSCSTSMASSSTPENKPSTYSVPVVSSPSSTPVATSSTPANKPSTYSVPVVSSPSSTPVVSSSTPVNTPSTYSAPVVSSPSVSTTLTTAVATTVTPTPTTYVTISTIYQTSCTTIVKGSSTTVHTATIATTSVCTKTVTPTPYVPSSYPASSAPASSAPVSSAPASSAPASTVPYTTAVASSVVSSAPSASSSAPAVNCPNVVPACINTLLTSMQTGCSDNTDKDCFCADSGYTTFIQNCIYAHGGDSTEVGSALSYLAGICASCAPKNPSVVSPSLPPSVSMPAPPSGVPCTTITVVQTQIVPCTSTTAGATATPSPITTVITSIITVPAVVIQTITPPAAASTPGAVVTPTVALVPAPTPPTTSAGVVTYGAPAPTSSAGAAAASTLATATYAAGQSASVIPNPAQTSGIVSASGASSFGASVIASLAGVVAVVMML